MSRCKHCGIEIEWDTLAWCDPTVPDDEDDIYCYGKSTGQIHEPAEVAVGVQRQGPTTP